MTSLSVKPGLPIQGTAAAPNCGSLSILVFGFISALLLAGVGSEGFLRDPDSMWHIGVGRRILESGTLPWTDELSHTFEGQRWIAKEWLSQVILALAFENGGWPTVVTITLAAIALTFTLMFFELARQLRPTAALCITMYAYALCSLHFLARPHALSYPILVLWLAGLLRAVEDRRNPSFFLLPLMVLWANLHGGFTLGLGIAGLLALEGVFTREQGDRCRALVYWAVFLAAACLASLLTPYGYHSLFVTAQVFGGNEALAYINEWRAMNFARQLFGGPLVIALVFLALLVGARISVVRLIVITVVFYMMLMHIRMVSMFALVTPLMIASSLRAQFPQLSSAARGADPIQRALSAFRPVHALILLLLVVSPPLLLLYARGIAPPKAISPAEAVDYIVRTDPAGRVYNDFAFNGYLIFRGVRTFIDGRTDQLFGGGFLSRVFESSNKPNDEFLKLVDDYKVSSALVRPDSGQALKLEASAAWQKRYENGVSIVYQRTAQ